MSNDLTPSTSGSSPSPQQSQTAPEIWITAAEAASVLHLSLRTVLSRAASGKLPARIPDIPPQMVCYCRERRVANYQVL